jgi:hypothetical protein
MLGEALVLESRIATERNLPGQAVEPAEAAIEIFRSQRRPGWRANAQLALAHAWEASRGPDPGLAKLVARVRATNVRAGDAAGTVSASLLEGKVASALGRRRGALAAFDRAAVVAAGGPALLRVQGRLATALAAELRSDGALVSRSCRYGLADLDGYRASFASAELRARAAGHGAELAAVGLRNAVRSRRPDRIWSWMERTRAAALAPAITRRPQPEITPLLAELRTVYAELGTPSPEAVSDEARLLRRLSHLEGQIRTLTWRREAATTDRRTQRDATPSMGHAPTRQTLETVRRDLGDRLLVEYGSLDGRVHAVGVTRRGLVHRVLATTAEVATETKLLGMSLRRLTRPGSDAVFRTAQESAEHALRRLGELLVAPLADSIPDTDEIVIVPPGELIGRGGPPQLAYPRRIGSCR